MGMDYTVYENWYKYMSTVFNQIQGLSDYSAQSYIGQAQTADRTFSNTFLAALQRMNAQQGQTATMTGTASSAQSMDSIFEEAAQLYDVPVNLLKAIGKAESGFDANAVSSAGAQGVMQLMPSTAKSLGVDDPFDARSNIMGGAKYISEKIKQYNGNIELALAAYNAGSGNVAKYGGVPPFKETRNYIARIKEYMKSELSTGKTVEVQKSDTDIQATGLQQTGMYAGVNNLYNILRSGTGSTYNLSQTGTGSTYNLSQTDAQYFVDMMRIKMLTQASGLSWLSADSDEQNLFL